MKLACVCLPELKSPEQQGWPSGTLSVCLSALLPAVRISGQGQQVLYLARGDSVRLGCPYVLDPEDNGPNDLDIEWTLVSPVHRLPFLTYQGHQIVYGNAPSLRQRVAFLIQDPSQYDASIRLANLQVSDSATYECKVKKATVDTRQITVNVLGKPAAPRCWMDGEPALGRDLMLRCRSDGGSPPLSYEWSKMGDYGMSWLPPRTVQGNSGDMLIQSLSQEHGGTYCCRATNKVGYSQCMVQVSIPRTSYSGRLGGTREDGPAPPPPPRPGRCLSAQSGSMNKTRGSDSSSLQLSPEPSIGSSLMR
uniref:V-set and immunoglobulin domain containing 8 n=1 Tax=Pelusios castaneus TaxID=367368 RepID=A0A8C8SEB4_9SAUR